MDSDKSAGPMMSIIETEPGGCLIDRFCWNEDSLTMLGDLLELELMSELPSEIYGRERWMSWCERGCSSESIAGTDTDSTERS